MRYWWLASRTPSVVKILFPIALGVSIGYSTHGTFDVVTLLLAMAYGWLNQLTIIFLNDAADYSADIYHSKKFPHLIDPRVIPNRWLTHRQILIAGWVATLLMIAVTVVAALWCYRPFAPAFALLSVAFIWAYSFPPIKINYRGYGELLEMTGVGVILPWLGFYFCTGDIAFPVVTAIPMMLLALSGSIASTLKHMPADIETGKRTVPVRNGLTAANRITLSALLAAMVATVVIVALGYFHPAALVITLILPAIYVRQMIVAFPLVDHEHLDSMKRFKRALNNATHLIVAGMITGFVLWRQL